jgi:hypothetical protein
MKGIWVSENIEGWSRDRWRASYIKIDLSGLDFRPENPGPIRLKTPRTSVQFAGRGKRAAEAASVSLNTADSAGFRPGRRPDSVGVEKARFLRLFGGKHGHKDGQYDQGAGQPARSIDRGSHQAEPIAGVARGAPTGGSARARAQTNGAVAADE